MTSIRTRLAVAGTAGVLSVAGLAATAATANAATAAAPRCGNSSLSVTATFSQGGAGHGWMALIYRNASHHTCTVTGYPGLDAITKSGHVLAHAKRTLDGYGGGGTLRSVTIKPGGYASASVEWLNFNPVTSGNCTFSAAINTTVANTSKVHRLPVSVSVCDLQVHPTVSGTPQYPNFGPAQYNWIQGSKVDAADMDLYLGRAEHDLKVTGDYPTQVAQLKQLISLPLTGETATQRHEAHVDVAALDMFFATPGLYT